MEVYLNGQVPVQFPDNATENDVAAFFQGQKARGGGVWDNAFQIAGMLGQQQQPQAPTVAGQFPVFGNAVGLSQEQFEGLNRTFMGVGQQQLQQQQLAQQQQQFNAAQAMEQRAQTQAQLQSEKDRAQQLKLEQQRFKNDQLLEQIRLDRQMALEKAKADREAEDKKAELERGTVTSGVGGQQLVRRINPQTGQWEVLPLNEPIFAPRGGGRGGGGAGAGGALGSSIQIQDPETKELVTVQKFNPYGDYIDPKTGKVYPRSAFASGGGQQPGYHEVFKSEDDGMGNVTWLDRYGNRLVSGQGWVDIGIPQQAAVSAATDTPPPPADEKGIFSWLTGVNVGSGKETGASAAVKCAQAGIPAFKEGKYYVNSGGKVSEVQPGTPGSMRYSGGKMYADGETVPPVAETPKKSIGEKVSDVAKSVAGAVTSGMSVIPQPKTPADLPFKTTIPTGTPIASSARPDIPVVQQRGIIEPMPGETYEQAANRTIAELKANGRDDLAYQAVIELQNYKKQNYQPTQDWFK